MEILTAQEMSAADHRSVEQGVSVGELMAHAGEAVAEFCLHRYPLGANFIVVLCGKGNNGGDGMVAARVLAENGRVVRVVLLGAAGELKDDAADAWRAIKRIERVEAREEWEIERALADADLIVDAVVGTGFKPPLRGLAVAARDLIAKMHVPVVAVDLPSGWDADSTEQQPRDEQGKPLAFRANAVVTFERPKLAHVFGHLTSPDVFGPVVVAPIGMPEGAVQSQSQLTWTGSAKPLAEKPRDINSNKGKYGHALIVGGAVGKAGAPSMASLAALRTGAGLVTAAVSADVLPGVAQITPELMTTAAEFNAAQLADEKLEELLKGITVVGIGPGLGQNGDVPEFVRGFVERVSLPMVIDADGLNALAGHTDVLKLASSAKDKDDKPRVLVLTPHPGEMARLLGVTVKDVEADRVSLARKFATEHGVTLVLKGWRTLVAHPDGRVAVNTTGNPSMAKGGSGDILTGIVTAMLAQYRDDVPRAVEAAVFLHGLAGDYACLAQDEHTVLATDTVAHLANAFRTRVRDTDGAAWICGLAAREGRH
jgi:NAD(P)H-hydrate epimerase